jgi:DNA-binding PadR family transcriptional regulator
VAGVALRHAILAALLEGEASGYQLAKRFDVSVSNFWAATPQQLYRELERMEGEGVISARLVRQERRPDKRVFSVTGAGRAELAAFTTRPARPSAVRDELLVKLQAVDVGDADAVAAAIADRVEHARAKLARYEALRDDLLDGRSEREYLRGAERIGPYLTLMRGRSFERENIAWGEAVLKILAARAKARA